MMKNILKNYKTLKKMIKKNIYIFFSLFSIFSKIQPSVLMYHSISDQKHPLSVSVKVFEKQIKYLVDNGYTFLKLKDLLDIEKFYNQKAVLITFDDGLEDVYFNAIPILKKYKVPAIFFVPSDLLGIKFTRPEFKCMNLDQVVEISNNEQFEIGSHTLSHRKLNHLTNDEINKELSLSKLFLEEKLNKEILSFAAPFGKYDQRVLSELIKDGYKFAFSTVPNSLENKFSLLEIPRIMIDSTVSYNFFGVFTGGYACFLKFCKILFNN